MSSDMTPELADTLEKLARALDSLEQRMAALTAAVGILIGMARVKGVLAEDEQEQAFAMMEAVTAHLGQPVGTALLQALRGAAGMVEGGPAA